MEQLKDATLIAALHNAYPAIREHIKELTDRVEELEEKL